MTGQSIPINTHGYFELGNPESYLPQPGQDWILHPYNRVTNNSAGRTHIQEAAFTNKGLLRCARRWRSSGGRSARDLLTQFEFSSQGLVTQEARAGGDTGSLATHVVCPSAIGSIPGTASAGSKFVLQHQYQHLVRNRTQIAGFPFTLDLTIDRNTGLPSSSKDVAGLRTSLHYDRQGRLTRVAPESRLQEAETQIVYTFDPNKAVNITERKVWQGVTLTQTLSFLDDLGRVQRQRRLHPNGGESKQETNFDVLGRLRWQTTWQDRTGSIFNSNLRTEYFGYDPFGRPSKIETPDDQETLFSYSGDRLKETTVQIRSFDPVTQTSPERASSTREFFDGLGRAERVEAGVVSVGAPLHTTYFTYDPSGATLSARRAGGGLSQIRYWNWDGAGLMTSEDLPEIGASGTARGRVGYSWDALGNMRSKDNGLHPLSYHYDLGGRLVRVQEGGRVWKEWTYGASNSGTNYAQGRVVRAVRHNYVTPTDDHAVSHDYVYSGRLGLASQVTAQLRWPDNPPGQQEGASFSWTREYDPLGNLSRLGLPVCADPTPDFRCNGPGDSPIPNHFVITTYSAGMPVRTHSQPFAISADYSYHKRDPSGLTDYMMARNYIFPMMRFGSVDPARDGWNLYVYVGNNPINTTDPDGRIPLGLAKRLLKLAIKGGDVAATFAGAIEDTRTIFSSNATTADRMIAAASLASEIWSPVSGRELKAGAQYVGILDDAADSGKALSSGSRVLSSGAARFPDKPGQIKHIFRDA